MVGRISKASFLAALLSLALAAPALALAPKPPSKPPPESGRGYFSRTFTLADVDLTKLLERLKRFGLDVPVVGSGKVTAKITVDVPWRHPLTGGDYRFHATLSSESLTLEGIELRRLAAAADYADGRLDLGDLRFLLWDPPSKSAAGTFRGSAVVQTSPRGDVDAQLAVDNLQVEALARKFPQLPRIAGGTFNGHVRVRAPLERVKQFDAWQASGNLTVADVALDDLPAAALHANFSLGRGELTVTHFDAQTGPVALAGNARLSLSGGFPFEVGLEQATADLAKSAEVAGRFGPAPQAAGTAVVQGSARGQLRPLRWSAAARATLGQFAIENVRVNSARFDVTSDGRRAELSNLVVELYGGRVTGSASWPLVERGSGRVELAFRDVRVGDVLAQLALPDLQGGPSSGRLALEIPTDKIQDPAAWQGSGTLEVRGLAWRGIPIALANATGTLSDGTLAVSRFGAQLAGGQLSGDARAELRGKLPVTASVTVRDVELGQLAKALPPEVADVRGRVAARLALRASVKTKDFSATGNVSARQLGFRGALDGAQCGVGLSQYGVHLSDLDVRLYAGRLQGFAIVPFAGNVAGSADVSWTGIDAGRLAGDLKLVARPVTALTSGRTLAKLPAGHDFQLNRLSATAGVVAWNLSGYGLREGQISARARVAHAALEVIDFSATAPRLKAEGKVRLGLAAPYDFSGAISAQGSADALPLAAYLPRGEKVAGRFSVQTDVAGTLQPRKLQGSGSAALDDLHVGEVTLEHAAAEFTADGDTLRLDTIDARLYGGTLHGSAVVPVAAEKTGAAQLSIAGIDAGKLVRDYARLPVALSATTGADVRVQIPAGMLPRPVDWPVDARLSVPEIKLNSAPVGAIAGKVSSRSADLAYDLSGHLFGGQITVRGDWHLPAEDAAADKNAAANKGVAKIVGLQLARLAPAFRRSPMLAGLSGQVDFQLPFVVGDKFGWPAGQGTLELTDIRWQRLTWSNRLAGAVDVQAGRVRLVDFSGDVAGGELRSSATIDLQHPAASNFSLAIDDVHCEDLLAPFPALKKMADGPVSAHLRGVLSRPWRIGGIVEMNSGHVASLPISDARFPLTITLDPRTFSANVNMPDGAGQLGHGRVQVRATARASHGVSLDTQVTFVDADLQPLLAQAGAAGELSGSRATGTVTLSGQNVRSLNDLSGTVDMKLRNIQSSGVAPLQQIAPYLSGGLVGGNFNDGSLKGRIGGGTLLIQQLIIGSATTQVFATGRISAAGGLDLDVLISNTQFPGGQLASSGVVRLGLLAAGPIGWLITVDQLIANRSIYLDVSGTVANPVISVKPLPMLADETFRFFVGGVP